MSHRTPPHSIFSPSPIVLRPRRAGARGKQETTAASHALTREAETLTQTTARFRTGQPTRTDAAKPPVSAERPQIGAAVPGPASPPPKPASVSAGGAAVQTVPAEADDLEGWDEF